MTKMFSAGTALALAALFSLNACSSSPKPKNEPAPAQAQVQAPAPAATGTERVSRMIAASHDEAVLETGFQALVKAENPVKSTQDYLKRVGRIYFRTEGFLNEYDAKLGAFAKNPTAFEDGSLQTDETYAKMIAAWVLREQTHARISYFYARSLEIMNDRTDTSAEAKSLRANAVLVNAALKKEIVRNGQGINQLAMQELLGELIEVGNSFNDYQISNNTREGVGEVNKFNGIMTRYSMNSARQLTRYYATNSRALATEVKRASADKEISTEVEAITPDVQKHLAETLESRTPQNMGSVVYPSSGSAGNMVGGNFKTGRWALTYDDGPKTATTTTVIDNLQRRNQKATFFMLAQNASKLKSLARKVRDAGMALGNHSYSHQQLTKLGPAGLEREIGESTRVLTDVYGTKPTIFRCPYGACGGNGSEIRKRIAELDMVHVFWNVDSLDWQDKNPTSVYTRVKRQMAVQKRGIILFHDIHAQSVEATRMLMDDFRDGERAGTLRLITIPQAIRELNSSEGMQ